MVKPSTSLPWMTVILLLASPQLTLAAPLYKWRDQNGNWHYSDKAPPEHRSQDISDQLTPLNISKEAAPKPRHLEAKQIPPDPEQQYLDEKKQAAQKRQQQIAQQCANARKRLEKMQGRVTFFDEQGNEIYVTEDEREQRAEQFSRQIKRYCPP